MQFTCNVTSTTPSVVSPQIERWRRIASYPSLTPAELQRIADQKRVSLSDVEYVFAKVMGWPKAGTVRDWNLTVQSWRATEIREGKVKVSAVSSHVPEKLNPYAEPVRSNFDTDQIRQNLAKRFTA